MENLDLYRKLQSVPDDAKKPIEDGALKGMTQINPIWRIQKMTEVFGPFGIGWWYEIRDRWIEAVAEGEVLAFVEILLYYVLDGQVSHGVPGIGGSKMVSFRGNDAVISDECYKMALTDAIGNAGKNIGLAADVYWEEGRNKYASSGEKFTTPAPTQFNPVTMPKYQEPVQPVCSQLPGQMDLNMQPMTLQDAFSYVCPMGAMKGKTLREVRNISMGSLDYYRNSDSVKRNYPEFYHAVCLVADHRIEGSGR